MLKTNSFALIRPIIRRILSRLIPRVRVVSRNSVFTEIGAKSCLFYFLTPVKKCATNLLSEDRRKNSPVFPAGPISPSDRLYKMISNKL